MPLDKCNHVVFEGEQIFATHSQAIIFADAGGFGGTVVETSLSAPQGFTLKPNPQPRGGPLAFV
jgi:hypothetical protein